MDWQKYTPAETSRVREAIEWSIFYSYEADDTKTPRVLLIGDSICHGYQSKVREYLEGKVNVTFWASSKCVTDPDYFKELTYILSIAPYSMVCFNNGGHSRSSDKTEWKNAYESALHCIRETLPGTPLALTFCAPTKEAGHTADFAAFNRFFAEEAEKENLPVIDLFSLLDPLDRDKYWFDLYHFKECGIVLQARKIADFVLSTLGLS